MKTSTLCLTALTLLLLVSAGPLYAQDGDQQAEEPATIIAVAQHAGTFNTLLKALDAAELTALLEGDGPYTLFAPTDEAFAKLPEGKVEELLKPENKDKLGAILSYHIVQGQATASDASEVASVQTLGENTLSITSQDGVVMVNEATVVQADIEAGNGIIHAVDTVLMPPKDMERDQ
jgi:uncharacterized surface protein with fasciclin (FAS1) repeats